MAGPIAGTAFIKVDGNQYPLKGNLTVSASPIERAGIPGQDYVHGFSELPRVPYIEADVSTLPEVLIETLDNTTDATVTAELINGNVYVLRNAWVRGPLDINTRDGQFRIRFEGLSCDEIQ